ncbi:methyltransferase [Longispora albida]|uniref:methyltransferase n=1 Tax=Longispora albida TaxID=203523 RepID=UPI00037BE4A3|nr:methyltransferase [Longispora albida]
MTTPNAEETRVLRGQLLATLQGTWKAQTMYAIAKLRIPDLLTEGPRTAAQLAESTGALEHGLTRLLRTAVQWQMLAEPEPGLFANNPKSEILRADVPGSLWSTAIIYGEEMHRCFGEIMHPLMTGKSGFDKFAGQGMYDYLNDNPDKARLWNESMSRNLVPEVLREADLTGVKTLVDVGGGTGGLLIKALQWNPGLHGTLIELPIAVEQAADLFAEAGLTDRADLVPGSFFDPLPVTGADAYVLTRVLHNWDDDNAALILRRVYDAMPSGGRLLVMEDCLAADPGIVDIVMLVALEGHDRDEPQYRALMEAAGFTVTGSQGAPSGIAHSERLIEAVKP